MLIEHLKADDINLRVTATRELPAIAEALGPERVRAELVPFINDSTDDEDEVICFFSCPKRIARSPSFFTSRLLESSKALWDESDQLQQ